VLDPDDEANMQPDAAEDLNPLLVPTSKAMNVAVAMGWEPDGDEEGSNGGS